MKPKGRRSLVRKVLLGLLILFLVSLPAGYGFMEYSTTPEFCSSCHNMVPYVKSWEDSSHAKAGVTCIDCHFEPGVLETLEGKFKASTQLAKYVTSTEGSKPWAQVSDISCMRGGCHSTRLLEGKVDFKIGRTSIPFDHTPHLTEMRRNKKLRCTSCHSQIVQGQHLTVTTSTCMLCHFKGGDEDPKLSECTTCHRAPAVPIEVGQGVKFEHAGYVERGVRCETCHDGLTRGTGEVPKHRCAACHAIQEHIDRYGDTEFLHRKHVTDHKVDCLECHTEMTHSVRAPERVAPGGCAQCHDKGHGLAESFYRGEGGRGVAATPNPMFLTRVGCSGCHKEYGAPKADSPPLKGNEVACVACHGPSFDGLSDRWQKAFGPAADAVAADVASALAAAEKAGAAADVKKALEDARHDAALVVKDGSKGVHNPWFARKLLESAHTASQAAWAKLEPSRAKTAFPLAPKFPTQQECALVCHVGIEERKIGVAGTRFDHATHVLKSAKDCDSCHSTSQHGVTLPAAKDCRSCHHAPETVAKQDCASCHKETDALLRGIQEDGSQGSQMMAKISCRECHGDSPSGTREEIRAAVQKKCDGCHKEKYAETVAEWTSDSDEWFREADKRLAKIAQRVAAGKTTAEKAAAASALVERMRRAAPAHNVLVFDETKDAFDEAASEAEK
jgi:nitrate/TMAO reductase-like tetraheme cytochrome c subunit